MSKLNTGWLVFGAAIAYIIVSLFLNRPPRPVAAAASQESFSAERAMQYLQQIAVQPHATGTPERAEVEAYLVKQLQQRDLEVEVQDTVAEQSLRQGVTLSRVRNIIARLPGQVGEQAILVLAHYDSQPNTPGAADDGAACAAMLEVIDNLQTGAPLRNDVLFVMTDHEEAGLLGARAFVDHYPDLDKIELVLNFEARGNSGPSMTFEISPENGWLMPEYAKAAPYPAANSLSYEIYKLLPNDTDYTIFRRAGIPGLNNAFIDGFVHYHSMTDTPERISQASLQHHGSNMLALTRHFGDITFPDNSRAPDVVFFNPIGRWLVMYPASWNGIGIILSIVLFVLTLMFTIYRKRTSLRGLLSGTGIFLLFIVSSSLLVLGVNALVKWINPHYTQFYADNFYNAHWYFFAYSAITLLVFGLLYQWAYRRWSTYSLSMGASLILVGLLLLLSRYLPTGAFMFYVPICFFLLIQMLILALDLRAKKQSLAFGLLQLLSVLPALSLWAVMGYNSYLAFSLALPVGGSLCVAVLLGFCIPAFSLLAKAKPGVITTLALGLSLFGLLAAQFTSGISANKPLRSALMYLQDQDAGTAHWYSDQSRLDNWTNQYISVTEQQPFSFYPDWTGSAWHSPAREDSIPGLRAEVLVDSINANRKRELLIRLPQDRPLCQLSFWFEKAQHIDQLWIDDYPIPLAEARIVSEDRKYQVRYFGPAAAGTHIRALMDSTATLQFTLIDHSMGIPASLLVTPMPEDHIPAPGYSSNRVQLKRSYSF